MQNKDVIKKYSGKVLGDRSDNKNFYAENFATFEGVSDFIVELESREADFTRAGIEFIKEYYGIENLARMLYEDNPCFPGKSIQDNIDFLNCFRPSK